MCTAITYNNRYFGRNLDLDYSYNEAVTITPRNFPFYFREKETIYHHYAIIGIATIEQNYPLYYDAVNEKGLAVSGLNFPGNCKYLPLDETKDNIAPFEFIPWILSSCETVSEAKKLIENTNLSDIAFSSKLPPTPLHFMISDKNTSIVAEPLAGGIKIFENPVGVLTNNPTFDIQFFNLNNYMHLSSKEPQNTFSDSLKLDIYSRGMGALGLPGDLSSSSRFVRAAFTKLNSPLYSTEEDNITQFFHILSSVSHTSGSVKVGEKYQITVYSSCCNIEHGIYYYTTYENSSITAVDMHCKNLDASSLYEYPLNRKQNIKYEK